MRAVKQWPAREALVGMLFSLAGCGYIGNPRPPALDIPSALIDLRAAEDGDRILMVFTIPILTTEGMPLKSLRSVDLYAGPYAGPANSPFNAAAWAETAKKYSVSADGAGPIVGYKISYLHRIRRLRTRQERTRSPLRFGCLVITSAPEAFAFQHGSLHHAVPKGGIPASALSVTGALRHDHIPQSGRVTFSWQTVHGRRSH